MNASPELFVTFSKRVRLCYQTFGDPSDTAVVLIAGHACSMLHWTEDLIALFSPAVKPYFLIRFDHRDTGLSTEFPVPGGYTLSDMAGDIEGLIDHLRLPSKGYHLVGSSLGGPLANLVAVRRPHEVRSLTLLYTSPGASAELPLREGLQGMGLGVDSMFMGIGEQRKKHIEADIRLWDALTTQPVDEDERKEGEILITRIVDRDIQGRTLYSKGPNHGGASYAGWPGVEMLKDIKSPTTVIQAGKDQIFGEAHGEALAKGISGAQYVLWEDVGHELPRRIWPRLAEIFLQTWKRGDDEWVKDP
ncbi:Alpha/Beta hydrolase protein [Dactylonectria estremocensis]|uniref:Alpha/Beta hydrolase protein n=1 Tax=Dactylonectria estremocensis TaxID=1079267 RepID=A0A9P9IAB7_9HYPO|nr:Alpha/Beta hydrolase protein [Dactylonectria estremocensis]